MSRFDGSLARKLDFGEMTTTACHAVAWPHTVAGPSEGRGQSGRAALRVASPSGALRGPEKYKVLEQRRRRAQINARRLLELIDGESR